VSGFGRDAIPVQLAASKYGRRRSRVSSTATNLGARVRPELERKRADEHGEGSGVTGEVVVT
jgi:hypothetical protein